MSDLMNAIIAAKLMGNGGGGGGGGGLPPITKVTTEFLNETISFEDGGVAYQGMAAADFEYTVGETYTIIWDNVSYDCVCYELVGTALVGNSAIMGMGEDTGEPFLSAAQTGMVLFMTANTAATHDCAVEGGVQSPPDGTALVVVNGEWKQQSGYAYENNGNVTPFNKSFLPTTIYEFEYVTESTEGINANRHGNYIINTSAFYNLLEMNRVYPVMIYGINIQDSYATADYDFCVPYAFYWNGTIGIGINNVKDTPLTILSGSKINGVILVPEKITL